MLSVAFSTRQDYYSMSCWGVVAAFLALPCMSHYFSFLRMPRSFLFVPCLCWWPWAGFFHWDWRFGFGRGSAHWEKMTAAPIRERDTFFDAIEGISPALWGQFVALLSIFGAVMAAAGTVAALLTWRASFLLGVACSLRRHGRRAGFASHARGSP